MNIVYCLVQELSELLGKGFERSVYLNKYKAILTDYSANSYIRERLDASFQGLINCLFFLMHVVIMLLMKIHIENIFFQDLE